MKYLLDTHAWIWWNARPEALSPKVLKLLAKQAPRRELLLSAISVWEFCKMLERGALGISCSPDEWIAAALEMPGLRLVPVTPTIALRSTTLPQPFDGDAVDQIVAATAREENATILTKDPRFAAYPHVRTLW